MYLQPWQYNLSPGYQPPHYWSSSILGSAYCLLIRWCVVRCSVAVITVLNVWFHKISIPPPVEGFWFEPPPLWKFQFSLTNFGVLDIRLPLEISNDPPWRGYGYFLEPHITYYKVADLLTLWERTSGNVTSIYDTLTTRTFTSKGV